MTASLKAFNSPRERARSFGEKDRTSMARENVAEEFFVETHPNNFENISTKGELK
jgi:hypothetical protein